ncbi:ATPase SWSAP1 isoform X2 [Dromaius novaehollandiae]|uniref:ATPase SWSAP1 isoform X2 n=1 Tax=Dromaius novaehollandiae TaxID=8790 RepID=UPI00311F0AA3
MAAAAAAPGEPAAAAAAEVAAPGEAVLVLGPAGSGRTALLLRAALAGGGDGPRAVFLAPRALPRLPPDADPRALQRLELRYPASRRALARELGALAARPRPPRLLLLDGLERYAAAGGAAGGARLAALLLEAARRPPGPPGAVLAALRLPPRGPRLLPALRRYFDAERRLRPPRATDTGGDTNTDTDTDSDSDTDSGDDGGDEDEAQGDPARHGDADSGRCGDSNP